MRTFLTLAALIVSLSAASADELVYRTIERAKTSGAGGENARTYSSYWIIDLDGNIGTNASIVRSYTSEKQKFYLTNSMPVLLAQINGKNSFSILATGTRDPDLTYDKSMWVLSVSAKGANKGMPIATGRSGSYPQTMTGAALQAGPYLGQITDVEVHLDFSYQQSMTVTNNDAGNNAQTILNAITSQLQSEGYQPGN